MANAAHTGRFKGPIKDYDTPTVRSLLENIYKLATSNDDAGAFIEDMVVALDTIGNWYHYLQSQRVGVKDGREEARRMLKAIDELIRLSGKDVMSTALPGQMSRPVDHGPNLPSLWGLPAVLAPYRALVATHTPQDNSPNPKHRAAIRFVWECIYIFRVHGLPVNVGATGGSEGPLSPLMLVCTEVAPEAGFSYSSRNTWAEVIKEVLALNPPSV